MDIRKPRFYILTYISSLPIAYLFRITLV